MRHHRPRLKLSRWLKRWLYASAIALLATGLAWLAWHYLLAEPDALPSPIEPWLLRLHGFASFNALLSLGAVAGQHLPQGWRLSQEASRRRQRHSGLLLCGLLGGAVLTAYTLYYLATEALHPAIGWIHAGLALLAVAAWGLHRQVRA